jgi:hypothetical protein
LTEYGGLIKAPFLQQKINVENIKTAFNNGIVNSVESIQAALNKPFTI